MAHGSLGPCSWIKHRHCSQLNCQWVQLKFQWIICLDSFKMGYLRYLYSNDHHVWHPGACFMLHPAGASRNSTLSWHGFYQKWDRLERNCREKYGKIWKKWWKIWENGITCQEIVAIPERHLHSSSIRPHPHLSQPCALSPEKHPFWFWNSIHITAVSEMNHHLPKKCLVPTLPHWEMAES